eukprot:354826-Prymnesium_polylepis.1
MAAGKIEFLAVCLRPLLRFSSACAVSPSCSMACGAAARPRQTAVLVSSLRSASSRAQRSSRPKKQNKHETESHESMPKRLRSRAWLRRSRQISMTH